MSGPCYTTVLGLLQASRPPQPKNACKQQEISSVHLQHCADELQRLAEWLVEQATTFFRIDYQVKGEDRQRVICQNYELLGRLMEHSFELRQQVDEMHAELLNAIEGQHVRLEQLSHGCHGLVQRLDAVGRQPGRVLSHDFALRQISQWVNTTQRLEAAVQQAQTQARRELERSAQLQARLDTLKTLIMEKKASSPPTNAYGGLTYEISGALARRSTG